MAKDSISAKTGNAQVKKLGHTSQAQYGQNPHVQGNKTPVRDESAK